MKAVQRRSKVPSQTRDGDGGALAQYFGSLEGIPLLTKQQEQSLAREIEQRELEHWQALLSYRPALEVVIGALDPALARRARKLDALSQPARAEHARRVRGGVRAARAVDAAPAVGSAAKQLRRLDLDRSALRAADSAVREAFAGNRDAEPYLARVASARENERRPKARFVAANLRLVIAMTRRYQRSSMPIEDLIQEGNLGLMRAVERFEWRRGHRFSTYATWWIRHSLNRAISDKGRVVRIPVHALDDLARVSRASDRVIGASGTIPSAQELASKTGLSEQKVERLKSDGILSHPVPLDQTLGVDNRQTLHDVLGAEQPDFDDALDLASFHQQLQRLLLQLKPIEAAILRFRFALDGGEELTLREIGDKYNLSRERIRQLQAEAIAKLRGAVRFESEHGATENGFAA
jgi:RNA polymerase primary sigma factor